MSYLSSFPESMFPPYNANEYNSYCKLGESIAKKNTVTICGLCRNMQFFPITRSYIERIGSLFKDYRVVLYENDSSNDTLDNLSKWELDSNKVKIISEKLNLPQNEQDHTLKRRTEMSYYRNKYLEYSRVIKSDYVIILDTDLYGFSYEGILNTLGHNLDVCGSNGLLYRKQDDTVQRLYFDSWAYRGLNEEYNPETNLLNINRGVIPYEVDSCFGGMCIYKYDTLNNVKYTNEDCDHVTLHQQIRNNGYRIWINPSQITLYTEHYYQY